MTIAVNQANTQAAIKIQSMVRGGVVRLKMEKQQGNIPASSFKNLGKSLVAEEESKIPAKIFEAIGKKLS